MPGIGVNEGIRCSLVGLGEENGMSSFTYQVQPGDTLSGLAQRYHVSMKTLAELNGVSNEHRIWAGQVLTIPGGVLFRGAQPPGPRPPRSRPRERSG